MNMTYRQLGLACLIGWTFSTRLLAQPAPDPYAEMLRYQISQPRQAAAAIEAEIRSASLEQLRAIEGKLLQIIQSPEATRDAKVWACRLLRQVGTDASVPVLGALLADTELSDAARFALRSMAGAGVDAALREAVGRVPPDLRPGVIQTIGDRGDRQALPLLAPLVNDANATVVEATLYALGHIGGAHAIKVIKAARPPERLARDRSHALLLCAESLVADGQAPAAASLYRELYQDATDTVIRIGALRGLVQSDPAESGPVLLAALRDANAQLRASAAKFVGELVSSQVLAQTLAGVGSLAPDVQVTILSSTDDPAVVKAARTLIPSADSQVRLAALATLGRRGDGTDVPALLQVAASSNSQEQSAARQALSDLRPTDVDPLLVAAAQSGETAIRAEAIRALASRRVVASVPTLLQLAGEKDPEIEAAAFDALETIAPPDALPGILKLLLDSRKDRAEAAAISVAQRSPNSTAAAAVVINALPGPNLAARCALLRILARIPAPNAMQTLLGGVKDSDATVQDLSLRALADWPDPAALPSLLELARTTPNSLHRTLVFRGCVRLAREWEAAPEVRLRTLTDLGPVARTAEDKKLLIATLAEVPLTGSADRILAWLPDPDLEMEAASAVVRIAKGLRKSDPQAGRTVLDRLSGLVQTPAARQLVDSATFLAGVENIASQGVATSPDGWQKDGAAGDDQAGIDGNPDTYWDKEDNKPLYRYVVRFAQPEKVVALSVLGYAQHNYAPKDFEILGDGKLIRKIENATYDDNFLVVNLPETSCTTVELKITGYYGASPAIRELGIYRRPLTGGTSPRL